MFRRQLSSGLDNIAARLTARRARINQIIDYHVGRRRHETLDPTLESLGQEVTQEVRKLLEDRHAELEDHNLRQMVKDAHDCDKQSDLPWKIVVLALSNPTWPAPAAFVFGALLNRRWELERPRSTSPTELLLDLVHQSTNLPVDVSDVKNLLTGR